MRFWTTPTIIIAGLAMALATGCGDAADGTPDPGAPAPEMPAPETPESPEMPGEPEAEPMEMPDEVTYHGHIRPLLERHCNSCHSADQLGPFTLTDYASARQWAAPMASAVADRRMPPYLADNSGDCGTFKDANWLTPRQIALFEAWAATGAAEGDPDTPAPPRRELAQLEGDLVSVDTGVDYLPDQTKVDDYRCFVVDSPGAFAATGFEVVPSNPRIAHHLIAYQAYNAEAAAEARALDAAAEGPGYPCLGTGPQVDAFTVAGWAPGQGATRFPAGKGIEIDGDLPLIIEMHYNIATGMGERDRTTLVLERAEPASVQPIIELWALDFDFEGPPGDPAWSTTETIPVAWPLSDFYPGYDGKVLLWGVNGHMHGRGRSMRLEISGSVDQCVLNMPRWDWDWQLNYWFEEPIEIDAADLMHITCVFDTEGLDVPLTWGDGTDDEMCLASFYATLAE